MKPPQIQLNDPAILMTKWAEAQAAEDLAAQQRATANLANDEAAELVRRIKEAEDALEVLKTDCDARIKERNDNANAAKLNEIFAADQRTMVRVVAEAAGLPVPADLPAVNVLPPQGRLVANGDPAQTAAMAAVTASGRQS